MWSSIVQGRLDGFVEYWNTHKLRPMPDLVGLPSESELLRMKIFTSDRFRGVILSTDGQSNISRIECGRGHASYMMTRTGQLSCPSPSQPVIPLLFVRTHSFRELLFLLSILNAYEHQDERSLTIDRTAHPSRRD
jgi:hypothetical protein